MAVAEADREDEARQVLAEKRLQPHHANAGDTQAHLKEGPDGGRSLRVRNVEICGHGPDLGPFAHMLVMIWYNQGVRNSN